MSRLLLISILALCPLLSAVGRIGETLAECKIRYGEVVRIERSREDYPQYCFRKGDIEIRVRLMKGRSGQEIFFGADGGHRMSQSQIDEILSANSNGLTWQQGPPTREAQEKEIYSVSWELIRSDGAVYAAYSAMARSSFDDLTVETFEFKKAFEAPATGF